MMNVLQPSGLLCTLILLILLQVGLCTSLDNAFDHAPLGRTSDEKALEAWTHIRDDLRIDLNLLTSGFASKFETFVKGQNLSTPCLTSMRTLFLSASQKDTWAVQMLDSWGKFPPSGVLSGTFTSFGSYDQCLNVDLEPSTMYKAQYCSVNFRILVPQRPRYHNIIRPLDQFVNFTHNSEKATGKLAKWAQFFYYTPFRVGVCLPNTCTTNEIQSIVNNVGKNMYLQGQLLKCESRSTNDVKVNVYQVIALCILSSIVLTSIVATFVDALYIYEPVKPILSNTFSVQGNNNNNTCNNNYESSNDVSLTHQVLLAFSLRRNLKSLLTTQNASNTELGCINGIRFWTMAWIIAGHCGVYIHYQAFSHSFNIKEVVTKFSVHAIINASPSVDTFYVISGLLTSYVTLRTINLDINQLHYLGYLFGRYVRLTPLLICTICGTYFLPYFGSGPIWHETIDSVVDNCKENWWINLLYLQNWIKPERICWIPSWWLTNDMHFHIMALGVLVILMRKQTAGLILTIIVILGFTLSNIVSHLFYPDFPPTAIPTITEIEEYWNEYILINFWKPYMHGGPFFVGLILGYFIAKRKFIRMSKVEVVVGWTMALLALFTVLTYPYKWTKGEPYSVLTAMIYGSTNKTIWALAIAWVIYASAAGYGGAFAAILSWKPLAPLSRLTYSVYLTHMWLIYIYMGSRKELIFTSGYNAFYMFIAHWVSAYFIGFIFTLFFESPSLVIQKLIIKRYKKVAVISETVAEVQMQETSSEREQP